MTRRLALYTIFGGAIIGSLSSSYLHLAAWLRPWMPPGWQTASYVAALSIDGLIMAPIVARQIVGGPVPGLTLPVAQWLGIVASVYVNARWGSANVAAASWADIGVGAAILPLFALAAEHAMRVTLAALQAREARAVAAAAAAMAAVPTRRTRRAAGAGAENVGTPAKAPTLGVDSGAATVAERGRAKALAAAEGVSERTAYRRLAAERQGGAA